MNYLVVGVKYKDSDQNIDGVRTPAGHPFHYVARIHQKGSGGIGIFLHDYVTFETYLRFQAKSSENYQLIFISGGMPITHN